MKKFVLSWDGWLEVDLGYPDETRTLTRLNLRVGDTSLTRNLSTRDGGISEAINVPLLPLAQRVAQIWWPLLYEPFRPSAGDVFRARHRLDTPMHGYVFPSVALCSGGDDTLLTAWAQYPDKHSRIEFLAPAAIAPEVLARDQVEFVLTDMLEAVLARLDSKGKTFDRLATAWDRVRSSLSDHDELSYCKAAGKLGLDPYDPDCPDLAEIATRVSDTVFDDISEVAFIEELLPATQWVDEAKTKWRAAPTLDMSSFGECPEAKLDISAGEAGSRAADVLRRNTDADVQKPRAHLEKLFGEILRQGRASFEKAPATIGALVAREDRTAKIATVARTAREQRFKACTAAYIAWSAKAGEEHAATAAYTRHQQASRAFAAELLAPTPYLLERSPKHGLTSYELEEIAGQLICPYDAVLWQAYRAGIPLRGVEMPSPKHPAIV